MMFLVRFKLGEVRLDYACLNMAWIAYYILLLKLVISYLLFKDRDSFSSNEKNIATYTSIGGAISKPSGRATRFIVLNKLSIFGASL
jgi:hypothetical protein